MKLVKIVLPVLLVAVLFSGCGKKYKTTKCTNSIITTEMKYTAEYEINYDEEDVVAYVNITEKVESDDESYLETTRQTTKNIYETTNTNYGGYDCNVNINGNTLISKCKVDYTKMDLKKYIEDNPDISSIIKGKDSIKLNESIKIYESLGAKCEK